MFLVDICHNYEQIVELCLEVFYETVKSMITSLEIKSSERLYESCLSAIHMYAKYHTSTYALSFPHRLSSSLQSARTIYNTSVT